MSVALTAYFHALADSVRPVWRVQSSRFGEVDALRGVAILMMVLYHLLWDLQGFGGYPIGVNEGFWHYFQLTTASLFIGIAGVSLTLRYHAMQARGRTHYGPFALRGLVLLTWGLVVGLATWFVDPRLYVRFGVLHLIGASILLAYPLLRFRWLNLALGVGLLLLGRVIPLLGLHLRWADWLGLNASPQPAFDYFPLIPWFGVILIGIFVGNSLYDAGGRRFRMPDVSRRTAVRWLALAGQNSLLIYLIHQPILVVSLALIGVIRI